MGVNVLLFDYRGYGHSEGGLSEEGTYLDAQAAHHWLARRGISKIIAFGESLGGGIASELALRETVAGLILSSTFTSIGDIGAEMFRGSPSVGSIPSTTTPWRNCAHQGPCPGDAQPRRRSHPLPTRRAEFCGGERAKIITETRGGHNETLALDPGCIWRCGKIPGLG